MIPRRASALQEIAELKLRAGRKPEELRTSQNGAPAMTLTALAQTLRKQAQSGTIILDEEPARIH